MKARAPAPPQVEHEDSASSLVDVDSPHVGSVKSDFEDSEVKTSTQATRLEHEAEDEEREAEEEAREASQKASDKAHEAKKTAKTEGKKAKEKAKETGKEAKAKAQEAGKEAKAKAQEAGQELQDNKDNPVVIGNAIIIAVGAAALGFGAYKKHTEGQLDWQMVGMWTGIVGAFAVGDYYASQ